MDNVLVLVESNIVVVLVVVVVSMYIHIHAHERRNLSERLRYTSRGGVAGLFLHGIFSFLSFLISFFFFYSTRILTFIFVSFLVFFFFFLHFENLRSDGSLKRCFIQTFHSYFRVGLHETRTHKLCMQLAKNVVEIVREFFFFRIIFLFLWGGGREGERVLEGNIISLFSFVSFKTQ